MNIKRRKDTYPKNTRCNFILKMFKTKTVKRQKKIQKRKRKKNTKLKNSKRKKMNMKRRKHTYPKHLIQCESKMLKTIKRKTTKNVSFNSILKCIQDNILVVDFTLEHCFRKSKNNNI